MTKNSILGAAIAAALTFWAGSVNAQTTFTVYKAVMTLSGYNANATHDLLAKDSLSNNEIINIARDQPLDTKNPKNIILAGAVDFNAAFVNGGTPASPAQLIVFNTDTQTKVVQVAVFDSREVAENRVLTKFFRLAFGRVAFQDTGGTTSKFISGDLRSSGLLKRSGDPFNPKISGKSTVNGLLDVMVNSTTQEFFVNSGKVALSGTPVGTFTE